GGGGGSGGLRWGLWGGGVRQSSMRCMECEGWVHGGCGRDGGRIRPVECGCPECGGLVRVRPGADDGPSLGLDAGVEFECVDGFYCLGGMVGAGGGAGSAAAVGVGSAWCEFGGLLRVLTAGGFLCV